VYCWRTTLFVADFPSSYEQAVKLSYSRRFDVGNTVYLTNACKKEVNHITVNLFKLNLFFFIKLLSRLLSCFLFMRLQDSKPKAFNVVI